MVNQALTARSHPAVMRLLAALLLTLALAAPAAAQQERIGQIERQAELRGAVQPEALPAFAPPILLGAPPSFSAMPMQVADPGRCRMSCAKDYYFCLAQDEASDCGPGWRGCVLSCGRSATPAAPGV